MDPTTLRRLRQLEQRVNRMAAGLERDIVWSIATVTDPPTNAEMDTAFGVASTLFNGFQGGIDNAGAGTNYYLCIADADNDKWAVEQLTAT